MCATDCLVWMLPLIIKLSSGLMKLSVNCFTNDWAWVPIAKPTAKPTIACSRRKSTKPLTGFKSDPTTTETVDLLLRELLGCSIRIVEPVVTTRVVSVLRLRELDEGFM